jgi:hypothetical protein
MGAARSASPPTGATARETFLNYFFGKDGPGQVNSSSTGAHSHSHGHSHGHHSHGGKHAANGELVVASRDNNALMPPADVGAGMNPNAAFEMKSLGKHIEAVSLFFPPPCWLSILLTIHPFLTLFGSDPATRPADIIPRHPRNIADPLADPLLLLPRPPTDPRPRPESDHAPPRQPHLPVRTEQTRGEFV